ncbi:hypothetical protein [Micromonospora carbonacea]|uniref:Uncharacterized protein n=1 Tax=Micromonospora carbonacea TaxID=47853 RepID=A0A1C4WWV0_9ACTN|nr:hypothetical protein [Micromonospora carbonacea]SCF00659.1 hypothetical protein GA0070563_10486 [Micromonospora carbonacea]
MSRVEHLRWRIAALIDRLPGQCWAKVADWPLGHRRWPWARIDDVCRRDAARCGGCYCGRLRRDGAQ